MAVVVAELKFRDVQRHIFGADFVERADHTAFEDRPESFDRIRVYCTDYVLLGTMVNAGVLIFIQARIDAAFVRGEQADFVRNDLAHESMGGTLIDPIQNAGDDVSLAANCTNDGRLASRLAARAVGFLVPVTVLVLTTNPGFINLDNAANLQNITALLPSIAHRELKFAWWMDSAM